MAFGDLAKWIKRTFPGSLENPATSLASPDAWLNQALGTRVSTTGIVVSPEQGLTVSSVWAAARMISSTIATLPLPVYRTVGDSREAAPEHPVYNLLHTRPNPELSSFVFRELMMAHLLLVGSFYAEIEWDNAGNPLALWPLSPLNVQITRVGPNYEKAYAVRLANASEVILPASSVLHVQGFSLDGQTGIRPLWLLADAIGLSSALEQYGASYFKNGATHSGVVSVPGKLSPTATANIRNSLAANYAGLTNAQRIMVLEEGMVWNNSRSIPPEASQFLESRKFQVTEIARVFGIPPHLVADLSAASFSNIESQGIEYVKFCIEPWCKRIESELNYKLLSNAPGYLAEFTLDGLLRGDSASRAAFYTQMANIGAMTVNEIRAKENLPSVPGGDTPFRPLNMTPITATNEVPTNGQ